MAEANFLLTWVAFHIHRLDVDPCRVYRIADCTNKWFDAAATHDRVVHVVSADWSKITILSVPGVLVAGVEGGELQLGACQNGVSPAGSGRQLLLQDRSRCLDERRLIQSHNIALHHHGAGLVPQ